MTGTPQSRYDAERSRVEVRVDDDLVAWVDLRPAGESTIIAHTEVAEGHGGEGLGRVAVQAAVDHIAADGHKVMALCPFASALIGRDPELAAAVAKAGGG